MRHYTDYPRSGFRIGGYFPYAVKWLLIINTAVFVFGFFLRITSPEGSNSFLLSLGLRSHAALRGAIWQLFTYMFLHGDFWHILFNMLTLWMFGADLERDWGSRRFLRYYFVCGVGAGICVVIMNQLWGQPQALTIGSSGAIYGILLAFGLFYPNRIVYFSFLFPIPAKYFVMIMGAIAFMSSFNPSSPVSNIAHLGGMIFGYLFLRYRLYNLQFNFRGFYQQWRRRRLQQKFQVYLRKQDQDRDRWVN